MIPVYQSVHGNGIKQSRSFSCRIFTKCQFQIFKIHKRNKPAIRLILIFDTLVRTAALADWKVNAFLTFFRNRNG